MRRYWHPIAAAVELDEKPTKPVRLLGEDLVLFKDRSGTVGLIGRLCPHRRVDLSYGIPEEHGLRCMYHGWVMDATGQCIEQPFEETVHPDGRFRQKVKIDGYAIQELAGVLWAYMGPDPIPSLPRWELLVRENTVRETTFRKLACNWLQCQENSVDPVHLEWLHVYNTKYRNEQRGVTETFLPSSIRTERISFETTSFGIQRYRMLDGNGEDHKDWVVGHPMMFPNFNYSSAGIHEFIQYRVPTDDTHTLHVTCYAYSAAPGAKAPSQSTVPYRYEPTRDSDGQPRLDLILDQDMAVWESQGELVDRTREHLGESDRGLLMFRKLLRSQLRVVAEGKDPLNVFREDAAGQTEREPAIEHLNFGQSNADLVRNFVQIESGDSEATDDIQRVLSTWVT
jgi:5,5'-dehydrodivanillate O-demethylase